MNRAILAGLIAVSSFCLITCSDKSANPDVSAPVGAALQIPGCVSSGFDKISEQDSSFTYQFTDKLTIDFTLTANCTPGGLRFATTTEIRNDTLVVLSIDTAAVNARCICNYAIHAEFDGLALNRYFILCKRIDKGVESVAYQRYVYRIGWLRASR